MIERKGDNNPVYDVQKEPDPNAKVRTLHRNLLLLCDFLPDHKPKLNTSSKEKPSYDYDDDYDDSDGLNPQQ